MPLAIHKVIEQLSASEKRWEDAAHRAVKDAAKSLQRSSRIHTFASTAPFCLRIRSTNRLRPLRMSSVPRGS